ncbi:MAG: hypothetical protein ACPG49_04380 [Chitinophagales bacterium]
MVFLQKKIELILLLLLSLCCKATTQVVVNQLKYTVTISINEELNTPIKVSVLTPNVDSKFITYVFPSGEFGAQRSIPIRSRLERFEPLDEEGKILPFKYVQNDGIEISKAHRLKRINYWLKPQFPSVSRGKKNAYLMSHRGFYAYFHGLHDLPFEVRVEKPKHLYGATSLVAKLKSDSLDVFEVVNYLDLFKNPILYAEPDTISFSLNGKTKIRIAAYSEGGRVSTRTLYYDLKKVVQSVANFMGDLPLPEYTFVLYFANPALAANSGLAQYGGLMCGSSSFYLLPEIKNAKRLKKIVQRIASHELLHLLTPYSLHSEKVHLAGFGHQEMSKHLWLYEGTTEYFTLLSLLRSNLIDEQEFFAEISKKLKLIEKYPRRSLTDMSERIFAEKYQYDYNYLYQQGALAAFALDIEIQRLTMGKKDLPTIIRQLADKYGVHDSFEDERLFDEIITESHPQIANFIDLYIEGKKALPFRQLAANMGMNYLEEYIEEVGTFGRFSVFPDYKKGQIKFYKVLQNKLNVLNGDVILSIDGTPIKTSNINEYLPRLYDPLPRTSIELMVLRNGIQVNLKGEAAPMFRRHRYWWGEDEKGLERRKVLKQEVLYGKGEEVWVK